MKKILFLIMMSIQLCYAHDGGNFVASDLMKSLQPGDKVAILMVHFGTTYDDTRALTIDALNSKVKYAFPNLEIREAYTSRIISRKLKERGIIKNNPAEVLAQLKRDGFTHIIIQSSNVIEGLEMESLRKDAEMMKKDFKEIRIGMPLLYTPEDYQKGIKAIVEPESKNKTVVLVGHGTYTPSTAQYAMLDYMLKADGYMNYCVTTIEGYPTFNDLKKTLKKNNAKEIVLQPFMFVAGDHAQNDIAVDMKKELEEEGYNVSTNLKGLGENSDVQNIFLEHLKFAIQHKEIDIMDKKKQYQTQD